MSDRIDDNIFCPHRLSPLIVALVGNFVLHQDHVNTFVSKFLGGLVES